MKKPAERSDETDHRMQFHFTPLQMRRLDDIKAHLDLPSYVQVVRQLIAEYHSTHLNKKKAS